MDIRAYLHTQMEWSLRAFGFGKRTKGITEHIRKELAEIEADPFDFREWVDVIILGLDGYWRHGGTSGTLVDDLAGKQVKNMNREWPQVPEDQPSLHARDKVYIAARFSWQTRAKFVRSILSPIGYTVTSRWLDGQGEAITQLNQGLVSLEQVQQWAQQDLDDIDAADIFLILTQEPTIAFHRGGRMTELGYAIAKGKTIWIMGPRENVFMSRTDAVFANENELEAWAQAALKGLTLNERSDHQVR